MQKGHMNKKVVSGFFWRYLERCGAQGVNLVVSIILARLLLPEDYGLIALVTVFITILNVFVDSGLGIALIQKKNADDLDFSSVFWFNLAWCALLYLLLFLCAPMIAGFYQKSELTPVLRVLGLQIVISGVKNIQQAYVSRTMQFRKFFFATLGGTIGAAVIGIWMAYHGYGVWALVAQQLFNATVDTIILWIIVKWRPHREFSFERLKGLFSYGWKMLASALLDTTYKELRQLIIGKKYTSADLAFYNRGRHIPDLIVTNIDASINSVLLPTMSKEQDDREKVRGLTRRAIKTSTYIMAPLMMGLAFTCEPMIRLLLTDKWLPSVPYMRIFCITFMFYPVHTANLNAIQALGRSDIFLKLEIIKKVVGITALLITMNISVMAMAYSLLVTSVLSQIINSWPNRKLLNYSYIEQLKDILPGILLAVFMGLCVYCVSFLKLPDAVTLLIQVVLGAGIYIIGSKVFHLESYAYVLNMIRQIRNKNRQTIPETNNE